MKKFDASIPRKVFWSDRVPNRHRCPLCHARLEKEFHAYAYQVVKEDGTEAIYVVGGNLGAFCPQCPIVVLDMKEAVGMLAGTLGAREGKPVRFIVIGILDMDAIPPEKANVPVGGEDNPLPLVFFVDKIDPPAAKPPAGKRLSGNQRRRHRKNVQGA
jgi:hypothetical protein